MDRETLIEEIVTEVMLNEKGAVVHDFKRRLALMKKVNSHRNRLDASADVTGNKEVRRNATSWGGGKIGRLRRKGFGRK